MQYMITEAHGRVCEGTNVVLKIVDYRTEVDKFSARFLTDFALLHQAFLTKVNKAYLKVAQNLLT